MMHSAEPHTLDWYMLQSKAQGLVDAGGDLAWRISDHQVSELKEHFGVLCLCQRVYDGAPMLACDSCSNWFHFGCVGRQEDPSLANEIENWNCPICAHADSLIRGPESHEAPGVDGNLGWNEGTMNGVPGNAAAEPTKRGRKRKKKGTNSAPPTSYHTHVPIEGAAKETLNTIQRVLPRLSTSLGEPDVYRRILGMYSRAAFQRAILGNHVPDEAFESASERELLKRLEEAMREDALSRPLDAGGLREPHKALCHAAAPSEMDEALQID